MKNFYNFFFFIFWGVVTSLERMNKYLFVLYAPRRQTDQIITGLKMKGAGVLFQKLRKPALPYYVVY